MFEMGEHPANHLRKTLKPTLTDSGVKSLSWPKVSGSAATTNRKVKIIPA